MFCFFADFIAIVTAYYFAVWFRFISWPGKSLFLSLRETVPSRFSDIVPVDYVEFYLVSAPRIVFILTLVIGFFYALAGLYEDRKFLRRRPQGWYVIVSNLAALLVFYTYFHFTRNVFHPRSVFITFALMNTCLCLLGRGIMGWILERLRMAGFDKWKSLLVGKGKEADVISELIDKKHPGGIYLSAHETTGAEEPSERDFEVLKRKIREYPCDMVICAEKGLTTGQIMELLEVAGNMEEAIKILSSRLDVIVTRARMPSDLINGHPLVHFDVPKQSEPARMVRRLFDVFVAGLGLVLVSPFLLLVAAAIKLTSKGPVLFSQERIGVNRKPFTIYKFRSMYEQAAEMQAQVEEFNESGEGLFKIREDPRVTPMGRFLRRFSLDELPQLINVLKGEMTIVGPRPLPRRDFENYYEEWHYSRHEGLPGLTCLWQISGRSDVSFHDMCVLDVYYLRNRNWVLDVKIIFRTIWVVLFAKGAY